MEGEQMVKRPSRVKELAALQQRLAALEAENRQLREEQENRQLLQNFELLLHALPAGLILLDRHNSILQFNDSARRLLQLSAQPTQQRPVHEVLQGHPLEQELLAALNNNQPDHDLQLEQILSTGSQPLTLRLQSSKLRGKDGTLIGTALLLSDLSDACEQSHLQAEALHMAGHELRNPLTILIGFTELLLNQPNLSCDQQQQFLNYILEKAQLMTRIVADLQQVARIETKKPLQIRPLLCDLRDTLRQIVEETEWHHPKHGFDIDLPGAPLLAMVDPGRITQALTNLLSNAVKYSPDGGTIRVQAVVERNEVKVMISDQGLGIPVNETERVFDRYYRAEAHRDRVRGLGLGLTITQAIVQAHGGEIWLRSKPGSGTSVCFTLPGARTVLKQSPTRSRRKAYGPVGISSLNG